jgi:hypothetical protein
LRSLFEAERNLPQLKQLVKRFEHEPTVKPFLIGPTYPPSLPRSQHSRLITHGADERGSKLAATAARLLECPSKDKLKMEMVVVMELQEVVVTADHQRRRRHRIDRIQRNIAIIKGTRKSFYPVAETSLAANPTATARISRAKAPLPLIPSTRPTST